MVKRHFGSWCMAFFQFTCNLCIARDDCAPCTIAAAPAIYLFRHSICGLFSSSFRHSASVFRVLAETVRAYAANIYTIVKRALHKFRLHISMLIVDCLRTIAKQLHATKRGDLADSDPPYDDA